jgi:regulator of replication initiation timing
MGTVNGGTIISFTPTPSLHAVNSRMPSHHHSNGCANFTFQIPSIANAAKKNTNSAERRANHNAVERARRECLNTKFQELAHALPSLAQVRRPSKSIIVQKSLDFIYTARQKDEMHDKEMRSIRNENDLLREEINKLREQLGLEPYPPREESKPSTSQQADEAKEDAKVSSSKNSNSTEIKIEADNNTTTTTNAQESINSVDIQIKTEECRSDDDVSNGNTEEDYDLEASEVIDCKNTEINQPIETQHHQQQQPCLYETLIGYPTSILEQHNYPTSEFNYAMDMSPIEHIVDPNSLHLPFDHHPDQLNDDLSAFCDFPLQPPKMYPSPPYEAAMLNEIASHMSWEHHM